jgi:hypothetical protein
VHFQDKFLILIQLHMITTCPLFSLEIVSQFVTFTGFPFDFAKDREPVERPVEPRVSLREAELVLNDGLAP